MSQGDRRARRAGVAGVWRVYISSFFTVDVRSLGLGVTYNLGAIAGGLSPVWGGLGSAIVALVVFWSAVLLILVGFDIQPCRKRGKRLDVAFIAPGLKPDSHPLRPGREPDAAPKRNSRSI